MSVYKTVEESDERLQDEDNLCAKIDVKPLHVGGRKNGDKNISPMMRTLIGAAAEIDGNNAATARTFGVSDRQVANVRLGRTSHSETIDPVAKAEVAEVVEKSTDTRTQVREKASSRLASLFDSAISEENLATLKPREAISAAKDLATVIDRVTPKEGNSGNAVQFVIFAPRQKEEKEYETVDVESREVD
jgi:hypothetical protein